MATWGELRENIRQSILRDISANEKWSDAQLLLFLKWSMDEFCQHTAKLVEETFDSTRLKPDNITPYNLATDRLYTLAHTPFDEFAYTSAVFKITGTTTTEVSALARPHPTLHGYYLINNQVRVNPAPSSDSLYVSYYAHWAYPTTDNDVLEVPSWAEALLGYRIALHCYTSQSGRNALIRQFDEKGNREQNAVREQQKWLEVAYRNMLTQYPRQIRRRIDVAYE